MSVIGQEESEMDFKEPLSSTPAQSLARIGGSNHSLSSLSSRTTKRKVSIVTPVSTAFGLMGSPGVVVNIVILLLSITSDIFLAFVLGREAQNERFYYRREKEWNWFTITLSIILIPQIVINILSLTWYTKNKRVLGEYRIFRKKSIGGKITCIIFHLLFLGQLARYIDMLRLSRLSRHYKIRVNMGSRGSIQRLSSKGDPSAIYQLHVMARDTAFLDLMRGFFQDSSQLIFQIFLLYRSTTVVMRNGDQVDLILPAQLIKIMVGVFAMSWYLVSYQDELRRSVPRRKQLTCGATNTCLTWRICMIGSRILAIASFAALKVDGEGGLVKVYSDNAPRGAVLSFPSIMALILFGHWFLMVIWIHAQKTTFCITSEGGVRPLLEFLYHLVMGWIHVFCYLNIKDTLSRRRMVFFYTMVFIENSSFIIIWYMQLITKRVWLRVTVVFSVEALFVIGLSCAIGYYGFLQPKEKPSQSSPSSRRG